MTDGIIKGTGNSRYIKSVSDVKTRYPTYESFITALANGTFPIDIYLNNSGWVDKGTKIGKATLLSDPTASKLGGVSTPDAAFSKLYALVSTAQDTADSKGNSKVSYGTYVGTGVYGESSKNTLTVHSTTNFVVVWGNEIYFGLFGRPDCGISVHYTPSVYASRLITTFSGKTLKWHFVGGASDTNWSKEQLNANGQTYHYIDFYT